MQRVQQYDEKLLRILLLVASKLFEVLADRGLELSRPEGASKL